MKALLALADGTVFEGSSFGAAGEAGGEVVFNTSMTGYQEILTDPSYCGQLVAMTYPEIGNVGVNREDVESRRPVRRGLHRQGVLGAPEQLARAASRSATTCATHGIPGIQGIDTRALVRHLRDHGAQEARPLDGRPRSRQRLVAQGARRCPSLIGRDLVERGHLRRAVRLGRRHAGTLERRLRQRADGQRPAPLRRRLRLRHQAQHPAQPRARRLPRARRPGGDAGRATSWR